MKIILTNDDGIGANGIRVLAETLLREHEVCVCAPDSQKSGYSHSIPDYTRSYDVKKTGEIPGCDCYTLFGSPAECAKVAVRYLWPDADLLIAGINDGPNIGMDVVYSGTIGAAAEARIMGKPAIAVSLLKMIPRDMDMSVLSVEEQKNLNFRLKDGPEYYYGTAGYVLDFLREFDISELPENTILNINFPLSADRSRVRVTVHAKRTFDYSLLKTGEENGVAKLRMLGKLFFDEPDSDVCALSEGYISVTPLRCDMNDPLYADRLKEIIGR